MAASGNTSTREMQAYRKADLREETMTGHKKKREKQNNEIEVDAPPSTASTTKSKTKFVPLYGKDGKTKNVFQLPGRHPCQCEATKHSLIGNCLNCGRIVCAQEGSGPCFTCSNLVCTREEKEILRRGDKKSEQLSKKFSIGVVVDTPVPVAGFTEIANELQGNSDEGLKKAIEQKNQLLEFDRTCEKRTQVIDDEADYFSVEANQWLSQKERSALKKRAEDVQKQKHSRQNKITFDFAGRRVIEDEDAKPMLDMNDPLVQEIFFAKDKTDYSVNDNDSLTAEEFRPKFKYEKKTANKPAMSGDTDQPKPQTMRIQDRQLQEMSDEGLCLSIRQPHASHLITGIRKHEGREWYTSHRGRLWISSGNKQPTTKEVRDAEAVARHLHRDERIVFPVQYNLSSLLGCVNLVDCISQEQYREEHPQGELEDAYVWIFEDPKELIVKFPIKGKPKLFKLDDRIHQAAQKTIKNKF